MKRYANLDGRCGVLEFEIGPDWILLRFRDRPELYLYNRDKPGIGKVLQMKRLALAGRGLTTFVNQRVRDNYAERILPGGLRGAAANGAPTPPAGPRPRP
jgi:hypothetical protein